MIRAPHPFRALPEKHVAWIKMVRPFMKMRVLARSFDVSKQTIQRIDEGDSYADVVV